MNRLNQVDALILLGGPALSSMAYDVEALRWGLPEGEYIRFEEGYTGRHYRLNYPTQRPVGREGQFLHQRLITEEVYQALARCRGLRRNVPIYALMSEDPYTPEHSYELVADTKGQLMERADLTLMYRMLTTTFASAARIAEACGLNRHTVGKYLTPDVAAARLAHMRRMLDSGLSQGDVAREMLCTTRTIRNKLAEIATENQS